MDSPTLLIHSPEFSLVESAPEYPLRKGFGHRSPYDKALIDAAAKGIYDSGKNAKRIVEICCGYGDLLEAIARAFPDVEVTGIDQTEAAVKIAAEKIAGLPNASVIAGDVTKMTQYSAGSVDFIIGQASMHHLTHDLDSAFTEFHRVLKSGGKCMFTFEPLSHNHSVNLVRSIRNTRLQLIDESNLYLQTIEEQGKFFSKIELQCFNGCMSYLMKALPPKDLYMKISDLLRNYDIMKFGRFPRSLIKAANFNVIFTK